jgi:hypothetical protein
MVKNKKFYSLHARNLKKVSSASSIGNNKLSYELIPELRNSKEMPFEFELVMLTHGKDGLVTDKDLSTLNKKWFDYQYNDLAWPIFSEKLMKIIQNNLSGNENLTWIECKINSMEENRIYYIPKFSKELDVLNINKTMYVSGTNHIIKPYYSLNKIENYAVFPRPSTFWEIPISIIVNQKIKEIIEKEHISEIVFTEVPTLNE